MVLRFPSLSLLFSSFSSLLLLLLLCPLSSLLSRFVSLFSLPRSPFCLFFSPGLLFVPCFYRRKTGGGDVMVVAGVLPPVQHVESGRQVVSLFRRLFE